MNTTDTPPVVSVAGKKNSGKTTFLVALAGELKRRGLRVASVKHGHHRFEIDQPGRDSWRHFHEGGVEAVLIVSSEKTALVMREPEEPDPEAMIARYFGGRGYDLVLVEGYKHGPFPKIEVFRRTAHERPVYDAADPDAAGRFLAVVTDDPGFRAGCPVIPLDDEGAHVRAAADRVEAFLAERGRGA